MLASSPPQRLFLTPLAHWIAKKFDLPLVVQPERVTWIPLPVIGVHDDSPSQRVDDDEIQILSVGVSPGTAQRDLAPTGMTRVAQEEGELVSESFEGSTSLASLETISLSSSNGPQSPEPFLDEPVEEVHVSLDENENLKKAEGQKSMVVVPSESKEEGRKKFWTPIKFFSSDEEVNHGMVGTSGLPVESTEIVKKKPRTPIKFTIDDKNGVRNRGGERAFPLESSEKSKKKRRIPIKFASSDDAGNQGVVGGPKVPLESTERFKKKPRTPIKFISRDDEENQDNVDTGWDELRNLRDEEACKRYGLEKLGLSFPVDPTKNLGYHGFRRRMLAEEFGICREWSDSVRRSIRDRSSLMIENGMLRHIYRDRTSSAEAVGSKRKRGRDSNSWEQPPAKRIRFDEFSQEFLRTIYNLKFPLMSPGVKDARRQVRNWERYLRHFRDGMSESELFLRFYDKSARLSEQECRANIDMEMLYYKFTHFYGVNPDAPCKDCTFYERSQSLVKHPF